MLTKFAKSSILHHVRLDAESASIVLGLTDSNISDDWFAMVVFPSKKKDSVLEILKSFVYAALIYRSPIITYYSIVVITQKKLYDIWL